MPPSPRKPFQVAGRDWWYATVGGKRTNLQTTDHAEAVRRFHLIQAGQPLDTQPAGITAATLVSKFLAWLKANRSKQHFDQTGYFCAGWLRSLAVPLAAAMVRPHHVQTWIDSAGWPSPTTRNRAAAAVKRAFAWGAEQGLIDADPIVKLKKAKARPSDKTISPEDWRKVADDLQKRPRLLDLLAFLRLTACRVQEARRIEARHVDRGGQCVRFPPAEAKGGLPRVIVCAAAAWAIVERLATLHPVGPIFRDSKGNAWSKNSIGHAVQRVRKRTGVVGWNARSLRHSATTDALLAGEDTTTVAVLLGHVDKAMVANQYSHLDKAKHGGHLRAAAERLASAGVPPAPDQSPPAPPASETTPPRRRPGPRPKVAVPPAKRRKPRG